MEKKKRLTVQEDKLEKSSALMQELVERDKKIVGLQNEVREMKDINEESVNNTYYDGLSNNAGSRFGLRKKSKNNSLYQS